MKTYAVVQRRMNLQITIRSVQTDDSVENWKDAVLKEVESVPEQVLTVSSSNSDQTVVEWGPALNTLLIDHGATEQDVSRLKAISARDLSLLSLLLSPRAVTKAAKTVIVGILEGRARDLGEVIIGAVAS